MSPNFDYQQKLAIYKIAEMMMNVDGQVLSEETLTLENGIAKLGFSSKSEIAVIKETADKQEYASCLEILSALGSSQKKFVTAFLGAIISSDGDIDDRELDLWRELSQQCGFPIMSNRQAIEIFKEY